MGKKREKREEWDDGRVIAPMTGEELPSYRQAAFGNRENKRTLKRCGKSDVTKKERRAMIRGMFLVMLPRLLIILAAFAIVFLLMCLWLS